MGARWVCRYSGASPIPTMKPDTDRSRLVYFQLRVPPELKAKIKKLAEVRYISVNSLGIQMLADYMQRVKK